MIFEFIRLNIDITDEDFNAIYPQNISSLSPKHWTPVSVAKTASEFLSGMPGSRVLDIGSGAGKFCMVGAASTKGQFTGVEQRSDLVELSRKLCASYGITNTKYVHANITSVDFRDFNAFYFFNPFYENVDLANRIDDRIQLDPRLYDAYSMHTVEQLSGLPLGVRLATYHSPFSVVPQSFRLVDDLYNGCLHLWEKIF